MSEIYFTMADETVSAAESYSEKNRCKDSYHRAFVGTWYVESGDIGYYADSKGNADGNAKQTAGTKSIRRCPYWTAK